MTTSTDVDNVTNTNYNCTDDCDECKAKLLPVLDELYCRLCDIGETCLPGGDAENLFNHCANCKTKLAVWYQYEQCPKCINN